jgi:hypothetical protein
MATRKQRRRREKEKRHEYETVYLDDAGNEVAVEPDERPERREQRRERDGKPAPKQAARGRGGRSPDPPSWRRSAKRTLIIAPLFCAFLLVIEKEAATAFVVAALYSLLFIPFSYGIDALVYRTQTKRLARRGG